MSAFHQRWSFVRSLTLREPLSSSSHWSIEIDLIAEESIRIIVTMGNTSSSRNRHISGDETGPSLTAGKFLSDSSSSQDNYEALLRSGFRVILLALLLFSLLSRYCFFYSWCQKYKQWYLQGHMNKFVFISVTSLFTLLQWYRIMFTKIGDNMFLVLCEWTDVFGSEKIETRERVILSI